MGGGGGGWGEENLVIMNDKVLPLSLFFSRKRQSDFSVGSQAKIK